MTVPGQGQEPNPQAGQEPGGASTTTESTAATTQAGQEPAATQQQPERYDAEYVKDLRKSEAATQRADDAESRARQALVRSAVMVELGKQGAANPARIYALVDQAGLEIDDDGNVAGADKAVEKLLKDEPYLVGQQQTNGTATRTVPATPRVTGHTQATTHEEAERLRATGRYSV